MFKIPSFSQLIYLKYINYLLFIINKIFYFFILNLIIKFDKIYK